MGNEFIKILRYHLNCLLGVIYSSAEEECIACKNDLNDRELMLCSRCRDKIKECKSSYNMLICDCNVVCYSGVYYSGIVKELISRLKYRSDFRAGEALSIYMLQTIKNNNLSFDIITYVPSTRKTLRKRGYNQSEFLAKILGSKTDTKVMGLLSKVRDTKDQIGLSGEERWSNLKDSYRVKKDKYLKGKVVLLVDDVITTGATGFFCAEDMIKNGAKKVYVLTAARSNIIIE